MTEWLTIAGHPVRRGFSDSEAACRFCGGEDGEARPDGSVVRLETVERPAEPEPYTEHWCGPCLSFVTARAVGETRKRPTRDTPAATGDETERNVNPPQTGATLCKQEGSNPPQTGGMNGF